MGSQASQEETERLSRDSGTAGLAEDPQPAPERCFSYDFRRPDRIPNEQLRSIHLLHHSFARSLAASLGAYLRTHVAVHLLSVEQLSFAEFLQYLPAPTCILIIGMKPLEGSAVLEINPSLVFPILDILLGGSGKTNMKEFRQITEIEQSILEDVLRIVLHDLAEAWRPVSELEFSVETIEAQPHWMQILSPNDVIVAIGFELNIGENRGMMNFGVPSMMVKMLGQQFDQQWSARRKTASDQDRQVLLQLVQGMPLSLDAHLEVGTIRAEDLLRLEQGDVLAFDVPLSKPVQVSVNGKSKFQGEIVAAGKNRAVLIHDPEQGRMDSPGGE